MKKYLLLTLVSVSLLFSSCSKKVTASFGTSKGMVYNKVEKVEKEYHKSSDELDHVTASISEELAPEKDLKAEHKEFYDKINAHKAKIEALNANADLTHKEMKKAKKEVRKEMRADIKAEMKMARESDLSDDYILMMILGILIAPIGLGLTYGWGSEEMWIGLILILLFWLPGAIYGGYKVHQHFN